MLATLFSMERFEEVEALAYKLTKEFPKSGIGWKVLGAARKKQGKTTEALIPFQRAIVLMPQDHESFHNLGVTLQELGRLNNAINCFRQALALNPGYGDAYGSLESALRAQGKMHEAYACYKKNVEIVFDNYAETFDSHLIEELKYSVPEKLVDFIRQVGAANIDNKPRVLDLGCGTGLVGKAVREHAGYLVGVDISGKMLDKARSINIYDALVRADLLDMMSKEASANYDLIVSADVFIYIGDIQSIANQARRLLSSQGLFAFSVESLFQEESDSSQARNEQTYRLEKTGRYSHSKEYITQVASTSGFEVVGIHSSPVRFEKNVPVDGYLVLLRVA